ncbi:MAG: adenosylcobinamide-phosphate synthase CbiB [Synergistaceae bacterium]|nr:adenosylcobinamide-phosphate synthase CbiB [Synergistaceae bacterium]
MMQIIPALVLDAIIGDPKGFFHPVALVGKIISFWEGLLYSERDGKGRGVFFCALVLLTTAAVVSLLLFAAWLLGKWVLAAAEIYLLYSAIAFRSLKDESTPVAEFLVNGNMRAARLHLSYIVGRDTADLTEKEIVRATVETIAEGYIDGIASTLFYMLLGAFIGQAALFAWIYKAINTMDSMVGYDNERYHDFGWAAAKLDDAANFIPARIGAAIAIAAGFFSGFDAHEGLRVFLRDRLLHKSPNSAHAESVFAGLLGIALGGGATYDGEFEPRPWLGDPRREPEVFDILRAQKIMTVSTAIWSLAILAAELALI